MSKGSSRRRCTIEQWNKVFWTDESMLKIFGSNSKFYVRWRVGERATTLCITPTVKHGGGFIRVWAGGWAFAIEDLHQSKGKLNQTGYHTIVQHLSIPSGTQWSVDRHGIVLVQDNDPKHISKLCKRPIKSKEKQHAFQLISWPMQWVDLNPIELLWDELDQNVWAKQPTIGAVEYIDCTSADGKKTTSVLFMTLNNLMVRFQWCWSIGECGVPLYCHCTQIHSGPEW